MSALRKIRIFLLGPDKAMLEAPPEPPVDIMTETERDRMKRLLHARCMAEAQQVRSLESGIDAATC